MSHDYIDSERYVTKSRNFSLGNDQIFKISNTNLIDYTPFENPQRWMGQNTFPILLLNDDNMIGEH